MDIPVKDFSSHHFSCSTGVADRDMPRMREGDVGGVLSLTSWDLQAVVVVLTSAGSAVTAS